MIFKCSVVIPCFNAEDTISFAIESALRQNNQYLDKIVVVDDCSTDSSGQIIDQYPVERVTIPKNLGEGGAKNLGFQLIESPFVAFLDSDDYWDNDFLDKQYMQWEKVEESVAAISLSLRPSPGPSKINFDIQNLKYKKSSTEIKIHDLIMRNWMTSSANVFRVSALRDAGGYCTISSGADFQTLVQLLKKRYKIYTIPMDSGVYGLSESQLTGNSKRQLQGIIMGLDSILESDAFGGIQELVHIAKRRAWLQSVAKTANYSRRASNIPDPFENGIYDRDLNLLFSVLKKEIIWNIAKRIWKIRSLILFSVLTLRRKFFRGIFRP